ncbi:MAG: Gfo/Idh/MocA family oxidoreductase [Chloroflexi bacterium]|nr:Gfo/Idh/MocA family oxidoreductase [Chloroflexota bacterium]
MISSDTPQVDTRLKVGIIGCGIGKSHAEAYTQLPNVQIVALAGLDVERCAQLARTYSISRVYKEYTDLLQDDEVQAVSIGLPNFLHAPAAIAALEAGKHVLCEKPLARRAAEAQQIVDKAQEVGKVLSICYNHRFRNDVQMMRQAVSAGHLGEVYYAKAGWMRRSGIPGLGTWFTNKELSGGGPLIDLGVHVLDMALFVLGYPQPLTVSAATYAKFGPQGKGGFIGGRFTNLTNGKFDVEDLATAFIRLEGGLTLTLETSWASYSSFGDDFYIHLMGDIGGADMTVRSYTTTDTLRFIGDMMGYPAVSRNFGGEGGKHLGAVQDFVDAILNHREPLATGAQGVTCMQIIDAIYQSAKQGREVEMAGLA